MKAGWTTKRLEELVEIRLGRTPPRAEKKFWDPIKATDNTWVSIADLSENEGGIITESKEHLSKAGADSTPLVKSGTLLVSFKLSLGKVAIAGKDLRTNEAIAAMPIKVTELDVNWLKYFFQFFDWDKAAVGEEKVKGKALNKEKLREIEVPLPPLAEQKRIVALLDEAFAGIDEAKAKAEENLINKTTLFNAYLESVFASPGKNWPHVQLDALADPESPITYGVIKPGEEGEVIFVRGGDLVGGRVRLTKLRTITKAVSDQYVRTLLKGGELLICLVGQPGQVAVAPKNLAGANIARQVGLIRLKSSIEPEFVKHFLQSPPGVNLLGTKESGSVQQVINLGELRQISIPCPDLTDQRKIVLAIEGIEHEIDTLSKLAEIKIGAYETLKRSTLAQAFAGELTA